MTPFPVPLSGGRLLSAFLDPPMKRTLPREHVPIISHAYTQKGSDTNVTYPEATLRVGENMRDMYIKSHHFGRVTPIFATHVDLYREGTRISSRPLAHKNTPKSSYGVY